MTIIALLQEPYNPALWERVFDRYGWPTLIVVAGTFIIYKLGKATITSLWPLAKRYVENLQSQAEDANALMREQLHLANLRHERESKEIIKTLQEMATRANETHLEQTKAMREIASAVHDSHDSESKSLRKILDHVDRDK